MKKEVFESNEITKLEIAKSLFRVNGIDFTIKSENSLYTGVEAIGNQGASIFVEEEDYNRARSLLFDNKLIVNEIERNDEYTWISWLDKKLNFSFLKGKPPIAKIFFLFGLLCIPILWFGYGKSVKSLKDFQHINYWCVNYLEVDGKELKPHTDQDLFSLSPRKNNCMETIYFKDNKIFLPGVLNARSHGTYSIDYDKKELKVKLDNNSENQFYNGTYSIDFNKLMYDGVLESDNTLIEFHVVQ